MWRLLQRFVEDFSPELFAAVLCFDLRFGLDENSRMEEEARLMWLLTLHNISPVRARSILPVCMEVYTLVSTVMCYVPACN